MGKRTQRTPLTLRGEAWHAISLAVAWCLGALSIVAALRARSTDWEWIVVALGALAVTCAVAGALRLVLLDFFTQFHYREKFALFLAHAMVLFVPLGIVRKGWITTGVVLVLISLGGQLVTAVSFHRYLAAAAVLLVMGLWQRIEVGVAAVLGWCLLAGLFLVVKRIRFALEETPSPLGVPVSTVVWVIGGSVIAPLIVGGLIGYWIQPSPAGRVARSDAESPAPIGVPFERREVDLKKTVWQAMGLAVGISVLIGGLYWYSAIQSRKRGQPPGEEEVVVAAEGVVSPPLPVEAKLDPLEGKDLRLEIFRQFRRLERALERLDHSRRRDWTAREYLSRLTEQSASADAAAIPSRVPVLSAEFEPVRLQVAGVYERARYALENPTREEVESFRESVESIIGEMRRLAEARRVDPDSESHSENSI